MCVLIFCTAFVWNMSHFKNALARYCHKCTQDFMQSMRYSCYILTKLEFFSTHIKKSSNIKFYENPYSRSLVLPSGQTDMKPVVAFSNFAMAPKNSTLCLHCVCLFFMNLKTNSRLLSYTVPTAWLCITEVVFTVRYAPSPYIKQTHFVFKGLTHKIVKQSLFRKTARKRP